MTSNPPALVGRHGSRFGRVNSRRDLDPDDPHNALHSNPLGQPTARIHEMILVFPMGGGCVFLSTRDELA